jgi:ATP-dependent helicase/nuclease subunit A
MRLREAEAIHALLLEHEREYEREVRSRGMLTFSDIIGILRPTGGFGGLGTIPAANRLLIDERLDARHDHWLLDEFQDTSRGQYAVLENLIDEVICGEGDRSFFCVGDVKQAIYGWRSGDARLFREIRDHYNGATASLPEERQVIRRDVRDTSWRSSIRVLEALNAIFGKVPGVPGIPAPVQQRWSEAWEDHHAANEMPGLFSWEIAEGEDDEEKREDIQQRVLRLFQSVGERIARGMTAALLVRSGDDARKWLEILAAGGVDAVSQSNPRAGADNPLSAAVRSAIRLAVHPGDPFARNHLSLEPLRSVSLWSGEGGIDTQGLLEKSARALADGGYPGLMELLLGHLTPLLDGKDSFGRERAASLREIARLADATDITDPDDFLRFMEEYEAKGISSPNAVQVMTIHKSKGLEYDMVVIPFLSSPDSIDAVKPGIIDVCNPTGKVPCPEEEVFLMRLPRSEVRAASGNERLAAADRFRRDEKAYEELCTWYVAMSRAKHALHVFSPMPDPEGKKSPDSDCPSITLLMKWLLDERHRWGDEDWADRVKLPPSREGGFELPAEIPVIARKKPLAKARPSDEAHDCLPGDILFMERDATGLGTEVHSLFESVEWLDGAWNPPRDPDEVDSVRLVADCLGSDDIKALFSHPGGNPCLWREKRFDLVLDGTWISGCFDRVVIHRDGSGKISRVELIDFKTDICAADELAARYALQLGKYRDVLTHLLKIEPSLIACCLIHVRSGTIIRL